MDEIHPTLIGVISASACAVIFVHAICQASRYKHRVTDLTMWCWVLLVGGSLWAGAAALIHQPRVQDVLLNVAVSMLSGREAWRIWRKK